MLKLLLVEDSETDAVLLVRSLSKSGYEILHERVDTAAAMQTALEKQAWDAVISDYSMPQFSAEAALALLHKTGLDIPFIVVSGTMGEDTAVAMLKAGAHDYLMKDRLNRLASTVRTRAQRGPIPSGTPVGRKSLARKRSRAFQSSSNPVPSA